MVPNKDSDAQDAEDMQDSTSTVTADAGTKVADADEKSDAKVQDEKTVPEKPQVPPCGCSMYGAHIV